MMNRKAVGMAIVITLILSFMVLVVGIGFLGWGRATAERSVPEIEQRGGTFVLTPDIPKAICSGLTIMCEGMLFSEDPKELQDVCNVYKDKTEAENQKYHVRLDDGLSKLKETDTFYLPIRISAAGGVGEQYRFYIPDTYGAIDGKIGKDGDYVEAEAARPVQYTWQSFTEDIYAELWDEDQLIVAKVRSDIAAEENAGEMEVRYVPFYYWRADEPPSVNTMCKVLMPILIKDEIEDLGIDKVVVTYPGDAEPGSLNKANRVEMTRDMNKIYGTPGTEIENIFVYYSNYGGVDYEDVGYLVEYRKTKGLPDVDSGGAGSVFEYKHLSKISAGAQTHGQVQAYDLFRERDLLHNYEQTFGIARIDTTIPTYSAARKVEPGQLGLKQYSYPSIFGDSDNSNNKVTGFIPIANDEGDIPFMGDERDTEIIVYYDMTGGPAPTISLDAKDYAYEGRGDCKLEYWRCCKKTCQDGSTEYWWVDHIGDCEKLNTPNNYKNEMYNENEFYENEEYDTCNNINIQGVYTSPFNADAAYEKVLGLYCDDSGYESLCDYSGYQEDDYCVCNTAYRCCNTTAGYYYEGDSYGLEGDWIKGEGKVSWVRTSDCSKESTLGEKMKDADYKYCNTPYDKDDSDTSMSNWGEYTCEELCTGDVKGKQLGAEGHKQDGDYCVCTGKPDLENARIGNRFWKWEISAETYFPGDYEDALKIILGVSRDVTIYGPLVNEYSVSKTARKSVLESPCEHYTAWLSGGVDCDLTRGSYDFSKKIDIYSCTYPEVLEPKVLYYSRFADAFKDNTGEKIRGELGATYEHKGAVLNGREYWGKHAASACEYCDEDNEYAKHILAVVGEPVILDGKLAAGKPPLEYEWQISKVDLFGKPGTLYCCNKDDGKQYISGSCDDKKNWGDTDTYGDEWGDQYGDYDIRTGFKCGPEYGITNNGAYPSCKEACEHFGYNTGYVSKNDKQECKCTMYWIDSYAGLSTYSKLKTQSKTANYVFQSPGLYKVRLKVRDTNGKESARATCTDFELDDDDYILSNQKVSWYSKTLEKEVTVECPSNREYCKAETRECCKNGLVDCKPAEQFAQIEGVKKFRSFPPDNDIIGGIVGDDTVYVLVIDAKPPVLKILPEKEVYELGEELTLSGERSEPPTEWGDMEYEIKVVDVTSELASAVGVGTGDERKLWQEGEMIEEGEYLLDYTGKKPTTRFTLPEENGRLLTMRFCYKPDEDAPIRKDGGLQEFCLYPETSAELPKAINRWCCDPSIDFAHPWIPWEERDELSLHEYDMPREVCAGGLSCNYKCLQRGYEEGGRNEREDGESLCTMDNYCYCDENCKEDEVRCNYIRNTKEVCEDDTWISKPVKVYRQDLFNENLLQGTGEYVDSCKYGISSLHDESGQNCICLIPDKYNPGVEYN